MKTFRFFLSLQVADMVTTLVAFRLGGSEINPWMGHWFASMGPVAGLFFSKLVVAGMGKGLRPRGLLIANLAFICVVLWNLSIIFRLWLVPVVAFVKFLSHHG